MAEKVTAMETTKFHKQSRFRVLGLDLQDLIRYFFGGNALIAVLALLGICFFLGREAIYFFPGHLQEMRAYRETGQEYVGFMDAELRAHRKITAQLSQAYNTQLRAEAAEEIFLLESSFNYKALLREHTHDSNKKLRKAEEKANILELVGGETYQLAKEELELSKKSFATDLAAATRKISLEDLKKFIPERDLSLGNFKKIRKGITQELLGKKSPWLEEIREQEAQKKNAATAKYSQLGQILETLTAEQTPLQNLWSELREPTSNNRDAAKKFQTAPERKTALESGARLTNDPEKKATLLSKAQKIDITPPDFDSLVTPVYERIEEHERIRNHLYQVTATELEKIPASLPDPSANTFLQQVPQVTETFETSFSKLTSKSSGWRHDAPIKMGESVLAFFLGTEWIPNSSWHEIYGLYPLFQGSFTIALVAIAIAIPFSLSAAIYVNQYAGPLQQNLIKPTIEFIQAIPSIVLGFFGIVVLGNILRSVSEFPLLSWVPGFPMSERLNILNASLLLAFMSIPTIFTLAEDALNNVPKSYRDASLALGSTRFQTILKVIIPSALSGIVAAILLGFGRIIGETMVVLLVAGNQIEILDFSQGLGVVTQPTHTMTGIIAQETAEVERGSLHWRALFMIGAVLFFISLILNFISQQVIQKFGTNS